MIPKYNNIEYINSKFDNKLPLECEFCHCIFYIQKKHIKCCLEGAWAKSGKNTLKFCSRNCSQLNKRNKQNYFCKICNILLERTPSQISPNGNIFCSRSCAVTYNNTHKTKGIKRSKLEVWLELKLTQFYPDLQFLFSDKTTINSELDIYIPPLKLAFELNGIFHYEPIFGSKKLSQIQNNDDRKFQACLERNIELCIIDTSTQGSFTEKSSQKYLDIIKNIIAIKFPQSIEK
jgi:hypothetical protein